MWDQELEVSHSGDAMFFLPGGVGRCLFLWPPAGSPERDGACIRLLRFLKLDDIS